MTNAIHEAAEQRAAAVRQHANRPSQRRCAPETGAPALARAGFNVTTLERAAGDSGSTLHLAGYATVTDEPYEMYDMFGPYTEVVNAAAPALALSSDPDVNLVVNHTGISLARTKSGTLELSADDTGLFVEAPALDLRAPSVQDLAIALERGDVDEMSFKFRITRGSWSPDWTEYHIEEFDINRGDVSVVNFGANPATSVGLRSLAAIGDAELRAELERRGRPAVRTKPAMSFAELELHAAD